MKSTKFDLMRAGRERAEFVNRQPTWLDSMLSESGTIRIGLPQRYTATATKAEEPVMPTMEIDGVRYREESVPGPTNTCKGCEYPGHLGCAPAWRAAEAAFGGSCEARRVIYIRAE
jgi:hypothetical protein